MPLSVIVHFNDFSTKCHCVAMTEGYNLKLMVVVLPLSLLLMLLLLLLSPYVAVVHMLFTFSVKNNKTMLKATNTTTEIIIIQMNKKGNK